MNVRKLIKEEIQKLKEDPNQMSYDDFMALPSRPPRQKDAKYSKEGCLSANKKVTSIVAQYLKENPGETSTNFNEYAITQYIHKKLPGFASIRALESLERKYKGLDTYFGYLIHALGK